MTDRYNALTVVLAADTRDDDAEYIINAIRMIRGVQTVTPHVASHADYIAYTRARAELRQRVLDAFEDKGTDP